jgi:hypothetical protein
MFALLWNLVQSAVPPQPSQQQIQVFVHADPSARVLQIVLSVAVAFLSVGTFLLGYRKRIRERQAGWYQKVVVDSALPKLFEFFKNADAELLTAASECERASATSRKTLSGRVTDAIAVFSEKLIETQNFTTERLTIFDERAASSLVVRFEALQDDIAKWFEECVVKKRHNRAQLHDILLQAQREVMKILYECEFKNF